LNKKESEESRKNIGDSENASIDFLKRIRNIKRNIVFREEIISFKDKGATPPLKPADKGKPSWRVIDRDEFETYYSEFTDFDREELDKLCAMIMQTGKYKRVEYDVKDEEFITFSLYPVTRVYKITFRGNSEIDDYSLMRQLNLTSGEIFDYEKMEGDESVLRKYYSMRGYPGAKISSEVIHDVKKNSVNIVYSAMEGKPVLIKSINPYYINFSTIHKPERLIDIETGDVFDREALKKDLDEMREFFVDDSYYTAKIHDPEYKFFAVKSLVDVDIKINPGPRYEIVYREHDGNTVTTLGPHYFKKVSELNASINIKSMTAFRKEDLELLSQKVRNFYKNDGYYYASVDASLKDSLDSSRMVERLYNKIKNYRFTLKSLKDTGKDLTEYVISMPKKIKKFLTGEKEKNLKMLREITFDIYKKEKIVVGKINVHGSRFADDDGVRDIIGDASDFKSGKPFSMEKLNEGIKNLVAYYNINGYLKFKVSDIDYAFAKRKRIVEEIGSGQKIAKDSFEADVDIYLREGTRVLIEDIRIHGNKKISDIDTYKVTSLKKGEVYNPEKIEKAASKIKDYYNSRGFYYFKFTDKNFETFNSDYSGVEINFNVDEGNKIYVGSIILRGNYRTKSRVIVRKIDLKEGEILTGEKILNS